MYLVYFQRREKNVSCIGPKVILPFNLMGLLSYVDEEKESLPNVWSVHHSFDSKIK